MLFEKLTENDLNLIENWIYRYGCNHDSETYEYRRRSLESILRFWDEEKSQVLYSLFGEKFILEKPITYTVPDYKLRKGIMDSKNYGGMKQFTSLYHQWCRHFDTFSDEGWFLSELTSPDWLAKNCTTIEKSITIQIDNDGHKITLDRNTKPIRALGKIAKWIGLEKEYEEFRIAHSQILNQKKLEGTLCLSIHPLDYLTMSDNLSGWSSCMNWRECGSYRMGTVEMMNSPCVLVAYLKSEKEFEGWNDKMWRCLFIVTPEVITSVKAYPYHNEEFMNTVVDWLRELASTNLCEQFGETEEIFDCDIWQAKNGNYYYFRPECGNMYNDFGTAKHIGALPAIVKNMSSLEEPIKIGIYYSGETECMCCGSAIDTSYDESFVYCEDCCSNYDGCSTCYRCGSRWCDEDMIWLDGECYCPDCFDEIGVYSQMSGMYYYWEDIEKVYVVPRGEDLDTSENDVIYCPCGWLNRLQNALWQPQRYTELNEFHRTDDGIYCVYEDELTEYALRCWVQ